MMQSPSKFPPAQDGGGFTLMEKLDLQIEQLELQLEYLYADEDGGGA